MILYGLTDNTKYEWLCAKPSFFNAILCYIARIEKTTISSQAKNKTFIIIAVISFLFKRSSIKMQILLSLLKIIVNGFAKLNDDYVKQAF